MGNGPQTYNLHNFHDLQNLHEDPHWELPTSMMFPAITHLYTHIQPCTHTAYCIVMSSASFMARIWACSSALPAWICSATVWVLEDTQKVAVT